MSYELIVILEWEALVSSFSNICLIDSDELMLLLLVLVVFIVGIFSLHANYLNINLLLLIIIIITLSETPLYSDDIDITGQKAKQTVTQYHQRVEQCITY
jgi:hypothetical protein